MSNSIKPYYCREHDLAVGNPDAPGQSKGAMIRHLKGNRPKGHGLTLDEARKKVNSYEK